MKIIDKKNKFGFAYFTAYLWLSKKQLMRNDPEYIMCKQIATYLSYQYPKIIYHWDYAGLNLSKAQTGRMKAIQGQKGWPDLFITEPKKGFHGLFIEIKAQGVKLRKLNTDYASDHIKEQGEMLSKLSDKGYIAYFAIGFDEAKNIIDGYLR